MTTECPKCHFENFDGHHYCGNCATPLTSFAKESLPKTQTIATPVQGLSRGTKIADRYEIIEELGSGGMGRVYRVEDTKVQEEIALKFIHPEYAVRSLNLERFRRELKLARKIKHKNVCQMFDLGEDEDRIFITMEYVSGETLKSFVKRSKRLDIGRAISISKQICEGLAEAHKQGVIHRDLKTSNIMIDREGNVQIMDFGIAREQKSKKITGEGFTVGTPEYMSPEQIAGRELNATSDIYSFGIILFEMLTGQVPFDGDSSLDIALKHKIEPPPDPREFNFQIPDELCSVIFKCLEKDRANRYQQIENVNMELTQIEKDIPTKERIIARRGSKRRFKFMRKFSYMRLGILLFIILLVLGSVFFERIFSSGEMKWKNSIAVLPFVDRSLRADQSHICEQMTRDLIAKLGGCEGLKIIPFRSIMTYTHKNKTPPEIGRDLSVATILDTYLTKTGETYTIKAELTDAEGNFLIASFEYMGITDELFDIQDRLSIDSSILLGVNLSNESLIERKKREPDPEAYPDFSYGKVFNEKFLKTESEKDFLDAVAHFEKAISIDETYALANWELGNVYHNHYVKTKDNKDFLLMKKNYEEAYEKDPNLAEANVGLGWTNFYETKWDEAYKYFKRSLQLDLEDPQVFYYVAGFYRSIGLFEEAIKLYLKAIELDPINREYRDLGARCYKSMREFEKGAKLLEPVLDLDPLDSYTRILYARMLIMMGRYGDAEKEVATVKNIDPNNSGADYVNAYLYAINGEKDNALTIIKDLEPFFPTHLISSVYAILGETDLALNNIQRVIDEGFYELQTFSYTYQVLLNNPFYRNLADDPRFKKILAEEKIKYLERRKKYSKIMD